MIKTNQYDLKTAVILTGAPRTWHYCKEYIVRFVNDIFGNVDWYVCLHESKTTTEDEIKSFFESKNQNLIFIKHFPAGDIPKYYNSGNKDWKIKYFRGVMHLNYVAGLEKRYHEFITGKRYHRVFFARPDCIYLYNSTTSEHENTFFNLKNFCFQMRGDYNEISYDFANPSANHLHLIGGLFSSDLFCNWGLDYNFKTDVNSLSFRNGIDMHSGLSLFLNKRLIKVDDRFYYTPSPLTFRAEVVRPTQIVYDNEKFKNLCENFNSFEKLDFRNFFPGVCPYFKHEDGELAFEYRLKSCWKLNIDALDYGFDKSAEDHYRRKYAYNVS
jgi:hypothetical protein